MGGGASTASSTVSVATVRDLFAVHAAAYATTECFEAHIQSLAARPSARLSALLRPPRPVLPAPVGSRPWLELLALGGGEDARYSGGMSATADGVWPLAEA